MSDFDNIRRNLSKAEKDVFDLLFKTISRIVEKVRRSAVINIEQGGEHGSLIASGDLRKAVVSDVIVAVGKITGVVGVASDLKSPGGKPYAVFVHEGTKPHFPPLEPIIKWIRLKGLLRGAVFGRAMDVRSRSRIHKQTAERRAEVAMALAIARKIARRGTKGVKFLKMALDQNQGWIEQEVAKASL